MSKVKYQKRDNPFFFRDSWNVEYYEIDMSRRKKRRRKAGFADREEAQQYLDFKLFLWGSCIKFCF